ncbi:helix-turn-helix domain-containing protein [Streptomyces sp. NPDC087263]|uniref:helix-turn-helix domain-containing protein n=1 Tax=Streptomyces sp. NPDC087263 TaxID=3365773 RepID=UPI0037FCC170
MRPFLNVKDAAAYLGLSPHTVYVWRHRRQGPPSFRTGSRSRVMYRREVLDARIREQERADSRSNPVLNPGATPPQEHHGGGSTRLHGQVGVNQLSSVDYQRGIRSVLSPILEAAVDDKRHAGNPMHAKSVRWLKEPQERREAWLLGPALQVRDVINPRNRTTVVLGLGCGLRQGEVWGLSPEDIDHARGVLHVRRQVRGDQGEAVLHRAEGQEDAYRRRALLGRR